jgi:hypothetical protein
VTETDELAAALDQAERRWPGVPRRRLIARVVADWQAGGRAPAARRAARRHLAGSLPGSSALYQPGDEWPA